MEIGANHVFTLLVVSDVMFLIFVFLSSYSTSKSRQRCADCLESERKVIVREVNASEKAIKAAVREHFIKACTHEFKYVLDSYNNIRKDCIKCPHIELVSGDEADQARIAIKEKEIASIKGKKK